MIKIGYVPLDDPRLEDVIALDSDMDLGCSPSPNTEWWAAWEGDNLVGYAGAKVLWPDLPTAEVFLSRAGVIREARGQGLQKRLIRARVRWASRQGLPCVTYTAPDNVASMRSLIACGFRPSPCRVGHLWVGSEWVHWHRPCVQPDTVSKPSIP